MGMWDLKPVIFVRGTYDDEELLSKKFVKDFLNLCNLPCLSLTRLNTRVLSQIFNDTFVLFF